MNKKVVIGTFLIAVLSFSMILGFLVSAKENDVENKPLLWTPRGLVTVQACYKSYCPKSNNFPLYGARIKVEGVDNSYRTLYKFALVGTKFFLMPIGYTYNIYVKDPSDGQVYKFANQQCTHRGQNFLCNIDNLV